MPAALPSRWKRRIRRILAVLLLSPFLLFALTNVLLATPWARGYLGRKLSARIGVETAVGQMSWTPWGGFSIGDLRCVQPEQLRGALKDPLIEVREIRVHPQWSRLLRGEFGISSIRIDRPRLSLSLEMAASMVATHASEPAPALSEQPTVAAGEKPAAKVRSEHRTTTPGVESPGHPSSAPMSSMIGTKWVEIVDAEAEFSLSGKPMVAVRGLDGKIPFAGDAAFSQLKLHEVELFGVVLTRDLVIPLSWHAPELRCDAPDLQLADLQVKLSAALGLMPGIPFSADLSVPAQSVSVNDRMGSATKFEARLQALGLVRHPSTWLAGAIASAEDVTLQLGGESIVFDEGRATLALQGGALQCPDVRLIGDRVSILGNGQFRADGEVAGVLRVVVPPDMAAAWTERLTAGGFAPVFAPLETPDRMFIDLRWVSYSGGEGIELGDGGPVIPAAGFGKLLSSN